MIACGHFTIRSSTNSLDLLIALNKSSSPVQVCSDVRSVQCYLHPIILWRELALVTSSH